MPDAPLTMDQILIAAEDVLRHYGPQKATVVDVARALGVSHGSVYRHFPSKAALRDAVTERWLARLSDPLAEVVSDTNTSSLDSMARLRRWFDALISLKRDRARTDPELFAMYSQLASESREVTQRHVQQLIGQLSEIITEGVARGEFISSFVVNNPFIASRALFYATTRFHNPAHAAEWADPAIDSAFNDLWMLLTQGLR